MIVASDTYALTGTTLVAFIENTGTVTVQVPGLIDHEFTLDDLCDPVHIARQRSRTIKYIVKVCPWVPRPRVTAFVDHVMDWMA